MITAPYALKCPDVAADACIGKPAEGAQFESQ
jgi:hypothetical protein